MTNSHTHIHTQLHTLEQCIEIEKKHIMALIVKYVFSFVVALVTHLLLVFFCYNFLEVFCVRCLYLVWSRPYQFVSLLKRF